MEEADELTVVIVEGGGDGVVGVWFEVALVGGTVGGGEAKETGQEGLAEAGEVRAEDGGERRRHARRCECCWAWESASIRTKPVARSPSCPFVYLCSTGPPVFSRPCLVPNKFCKLFQIFHHIEFLDACMEYQI